MTDERPPKRLRFSGKLVTVRVGKNPNREDFGVHEAVLKEESPFFRAALEKRLVEGQSRVIELPEDTPDVFPFYLQAVYGKPPTRRFFTNDLIMLAKLYVLSERLQNDWVCDQVIKTITKVAMNHQGKTNWVPEASSIRVIFEGTETDSPGRRCFVDLVAMLVHPEIPESREWLASLPEKFKEDLVWALLRQNGSFRREEVRVKSTWLKGKGPRDDSGRCACEECMTQGKGPSR